MNCMHYVSIKVYSIYYFNNLNPHIATKLRSLTLSAMLVGLENPKSFPKKHATAKQTVYPVQCSPAAQLTASQVLMSIIGSHCIDNQLSVSDLASGKTQCCCIDVSLSTHSEYIEVGINLTVIIG